MPQTRERLRLAYGGVLAPAKVNLALHVTGRRPNGYHDLDSVVVFAADGDGLMVEPAGEDRFETSGPFAAQLGGTGDNLVLKALGAAREVAAASGLEVGPLAITLDKRLPVASGIGGGSADAAALLTLVADAAPELRSALRREALKLGADVPMCLDGCAARITGIGEIGEPLIRLPACGLLLVNPGVAVATPDVFRALQCTDNPLLPPLPPEGFASADALAGWLRTTRNDLEVPARGLAPAIAEVQTAIDRTGALVARMSGSGATVYGLYSTPDDARSAAADIQAGRDDWWMLPTHMRPQETAA
ncbi:4-(cytidine 5'-diphospho)-2-C-methyl-D-erythritol kinase [Mangrovibrevibacter kandeliae]|uniref:4-(cytidine 5'-diphospho)-2-C-methyl-D-erythritol kinase n=1 Tax=Mangrovibrevibacter kandeliae TaxID=2968473 RepID=UPI002118C98F|nr:4-(cytidine 5'-diphospho)-2-C-methyl-D-erythritol kinase [Aurantimonas sp. CSK15Z-1]MCQ8783788.1 4-(cytidine 5'-diphospho)-2-C-methyl-D-erythritol kinase [Aurantimonas sp. CSK15Z-1]